MAQSDGCLTDGQEIAGSIPMSLATFIHGEWSWSIFYGHPIPSADLKRAGVSFWPKDVYKYCLTA